MSEIKFTNFINEDGSHGPDLVGVTTFTSPHYFVPPSGTTAQRPSGEGLAPGMLRFNTDIGRLEVWRGDHWATILGESPNLGISTAAAPASSGTGARGLFMGGNDETTPGAFNTIDYITISSSGNAINFGDLQAGTLGGSSCASSVRGIFAGGQRSPLVTAVISLVTFSSTGNASTFGNLTSATEWPSAMSNSTRGLIAGGRVSGSGVNTIEYITISSTGNAQDFGDLRSVRSFYSMSFASSTRGISGGESPGFTNLIDFVTISTTGNASAFGDLTDNKGGAGCSNSTRGLFGGAYNPGFSNSITFITIASTGNSQDFGDLTQARRGLGACASSIRGVWGGGVNPSPAVTDFNILDYVTIASTGNAVDFGDLVTGNSGRQRNKTACSNAHGGL